MNKSDKTFWITVIAVAALLNVTFAIEYGINLFLASLVTVLAVIIAYDFHKLITV